jgi:transcriptional/translational regulatory protein YebC/TACO1
MILTLTAQAFKLVYNFFMSGHSHWAGIKHKKELTDAKRGKVFSKLLVAISAAVKTEPNPDFNPRLRTAITKAKEASVPQDNIERAIKRAAETGANLEELVFEAYGHGGTAIMVEALSDNRNRVVQEIKNILKEHGGKWAESGSVRWAFESAQQMGDGEGEGWHAKFPQKLSEEDARKLAALIAAIEENDAVQNVFTNAKTDTE